MRALVIVMAVALALVTARVARADALQVDDNACLNADVLAPRIRHWARGPIDPGVQVDVHVQENGARRRVSFALRRDHASIGERSLDLPAIACTDAIDAVAVAIAFAIDANLPAAPARPGPPAETPPPAPGLLAEPFPEADRAPASVRPDESRDALSVAGVISDGLLSHPAPGLAAGFNKVWTPSFETQLLLFGVGETRSYPLQWNLGMRTGLFAGVVDACAVRRLARARLRACGGVAFGALLLHPVENDGSPSNGSMPPRAWGGPAVRLDARFSVTPGLAVALSLDGFAPFVRPALSAGDSPFVAQALVPPYGGGATAAIDFDLY
jgi:hypothetical protein